jgi:pyruvate dehydrogenase E2 component (dihydrolipoyllysine-residue acetyltransferase)
MARVLRMPSVAANATDAVLSEWLVEESGDFAAAQAIATVETEKAAVDVEADAAGRILKTLVLPGAQVEVGDPIAVLGEPGERVDDVDSLLASLGVGEATDVVVPERRDVPSDPESGAPLAEPSASPPAPPPVPPPSVDKAAGAPGSRPGDRTNGRIFASPLARKLAKDHGLTMEQITGTGPNGRILRRDVDEAVARRAVVDSGDASPEPTQSRPPDGYQDIPHSTIRRAVATRLLDSKQTAPHFYVRATVRAEKLVALRRELNDGAAEKISLNDLVVKAVAAAHRRVPEMNVVWTPDAVRRFSRIDVAVAVATDSGLLTPVVHDVTSLTVSALAARVRDLAGRARAGRLKQHELEGGSITVTNLGMYGVEEFAAIINPPHAAILAVGAVRDEPVVDDGAVVAGQVMSVTLSVDHRPVDGVVAARWMATFVEIVEHPVRLLA